MSGLGIFEACTAWLTLSKQKSTAIESTFTHIFYSANELWMREEFPNQEWFQFLHNTSYKQISQVAAFRPFKTRADAYWKLVSILLLTLGMAERRGDGREVATCQNGGIQAR